MMDIARPSVLLREKCTESELDQVMNTRNVQ